MASGELYKIFLTVLAEMSFTDFLKKTSDCIHYNDQKLASGLAPHNESELKRNWFQVWQSCSVIKMNSIHLCTLSI